MSRRAKVRLPVPNLQLLFLLLLPAFVIATSLRGTNGVAQAQAQAPAPTYTEVNSLFQKNCIACHSRSEEHTSELQSRLHLVCRLLLEKKKKHKHTSNKNT